MFVLAGQTPEKRLGIKGTIAECPQLQTELFFLTFRRRNLAEKLTHQSEVRISLRRLSERRSFAIIRDHEIRVAEERKNGAGDQN